MGPFPEGIMESEELIPEDRTKASIDWYKGPFFIRGSNRVYNVYTTEKFKSFIKIWVEDALEKGAVSTAAASGCSFGAMEDALKNGIQLK